MLANMRIGICRRLLADDDRVGGSILYLRYAGWRSPTDETNRAVWVVCREADLPEIVPASAPLCRLSHTVALDTEHLKISDSVYRLLTADPIERDPWPTRHVLDQRTQKKLDEQHVMPMVDAAAAHGSINHEQMGERRLLRGQENDARHVVDLCRWGTCSIRAGGRICLAHASMTTRAA
jgi:hypothetical protein